jgi:hypothetical protein
MAEKVVAQMIGVGEAVRTGYADLATLQQELHDWWIAAGPRRGPDNTDRSYHLRTISKDLAKIEAPELSALSGDLLNREVCAVVHTGRGSQEARKQDALAMLRPAATALARAGVSELADKIRHDIELVDSTRRIPGAYEGGL